MALSPMATHQEAKQSNADADDNRKENKKANTPKNNLKRKIMVRGNHSEKTPSKSAASVGNNSRTPSSGGRGGRSRRTDDFDFPAFDVDKRQGGGQVVDTRFFYGFIDDFDLSDLS
mmetsp:Transcript_39790/g.83647  ORF Transcript_39790/g.83647 Transcript_39790/m.83647 type:complete len:116 (+) Transcript_39790:156-503(+)